MEKSIVIDKLMNGTRMVFTSYLGYPYYLLPIVTMNWRGIYYDVMIWFNSTLYTDRDEIIHEVVLIRSEPATIPKYQLDCLSNSLSEFHEAKP